MMESDDDFDYWALTPPESTRTLLLVNPETYAALEATVERQRKALEEIAATKELGPATAYAACVRQIARTALSDGGT